MLTMGAAPSPGSKEALESLKKKTIWMDMSAWVGLIRGLLEEMVVDLMPFVGDAFPVEALRMHLNRYNPDNHYQSLYQW